MILTAIAALVIVSALIFMLGVLVVEGDSVECAIGVSLFAALILLGVGAA